MHDCATGGSGSFSAPRPRMPGNNCGDAVGNLSVNHVIRIPCFGYAAKQVVSNLVVARSRLDSGRGPVGTGALVAELRERAAIR
jgi:hypothetical protein